MRIQMRKWYRIDNSATISPWQLGSGVQLVMARLCSDLLKCGVPGAHVDLALMRCAMWGALRGESNRGRASPQTQNMAYKNEATQQP